MNKVFAKIWTWLKALLATVLGVLQGNLKIIKELATGVVNLVSIIIPFDLSQTIILKIREGINCVDEILEGWKETLLEDIL